MKYYTFMERLPSRMMFASVAIVVLSSIIFYNGSNGSRNYVVETSTEFDNYINYGELASDSGLDFGGSLIQFHEETGITQLSFDNDLSYDRENKRLQISKKIISSFENQTDYDEEKKYVFSYSGEEKSFSEQYFLSDTIKSVAIDGQNRELIIYTEKFSAFDISEDDLYFYITPVSPREKFDKIVVIDPGHGGVDVGAYRRGINEKDINLSISKMVYDIFQKSDSGIKVYMTRYGDEYIHRNDRPVISNEVADLFISIHCNTYTDTTVHGTSTHYNSPGETDLSRINITNKDLALLMQEKILNALNTRDRGIKLDPELVVLYQARVPAVLLELAYMSNSNDLAKLIDEEYQAKAAQAIYEGIIEVFSN